MTNAALDLLTPGAGSAFAGRWDDRAATEIANKPEEPVTITKKILAAIIRKGTNQLFLRLRWRRTLRLATLPTRSSQLIRATIIREPNTPSAEQFGQPATFFGDWWERCLFNGFQDVPQMQFRDARTGYIRSWSRGLGSARWPVHGENCAVNRIVLRKIPPGSYDEPAL